MNWLGLVASIEGVALIGAGVLYWFLYREFTNAQRDLLNRLMARGYSEYQMLTPKAGGEKLRRRSMSDAEMAEIENARYRAVA